MMLLVSCLRTHAATGPAYFLLCSKSFIVLYLNLWSNLSYISCEFFRFRRFSVVGLSIFLPMDIQLLQHHLLKRISSTDCFYTLVKNQLTMFICGYFQVFYSVTLIYVSSSLIILHIIDYSYINLETRLSDSSHFILFQNCFKHSSSFPFSYRFLE